MTIYNGVFFFTVLFFLLIPAVFLGINEKNIKKYGLFVTIFGLILILGDNKFECILLLGVYALELIVVKGYLEIKRKYPQRWVMRGSLLVAIIPLIAIKLVHPHYSNIKLLGISYLIFRVIEILIEIYDGLIKEINIFEFTYYILFFPTFTSGPIDRFRRFRENINKILSCEEYIEICKIGVYKLFLGLAYKYIFSTLIFNYWIEKIPKVQAWLHSINYMYAYTFYLFFDFAGYSLMAIGVSYILGVTVPENFNMPFISKDIKEFWNRWHMSLSFWFRDYVYTRFVIQSMRKKRFNKYVCSYIGYSINMLTMGIWHGTEFHYIVYGVYHAFLLITTDYIERHSKKVREFKKTALGEVVYIFGTFNAISFGMLIFSGRLF